MESFIRKSKSEDVGRIMEIIHMAQEDFREAGINQWQDNYPNEQKIFEDIQLGISYVLEEKPGIMAAASISFLGEPNYDEIFGGKWLQDGSYAVIHRIAVDRNCKRMGYAAKILEFAKKMMEERGVGALRIDTHEDNRTMQSFLEKQGFLYCGIIYLTQKHDSCDKRLAYEYLHCAVR